MSADFSLYNLLSQLILGYIWLLAFYIVNPAIVPTGVDVSLISVAPAFVIGYFINAFSSWIESFLFWTWGGKPSRHLIGGTAKGKIKFKPNLQVIDLIEKDLGQALSREAPVEPQKLDSLFSYTLSYAGECENRIKEFNANYAFSRGLIVALLGLWLFFLIGDFGFKKEPIGLHYHWIWILILLAWYRTKERAYYLAREFLSNYHKIKIEKGGRLQTSGP